MSVDPILLGVASLTFFIGGLAKGAMGFGLPMLAIPMITILGSLPLALSIATPPVVATNLWQIWKFRRERSARFLPWFLLPGGLGLLAGAYLLKHINDAFLEIALGSFVLTYLVIRHRNGASSLSPQLRDRLAPWVGCFAGLVHGTTGLSGLVGTPFFHAAGLGRPAFIFCNSMMFTLFSALHMPALAAVGLYQVSAVLTGVLVILPAFAGLWIGSFLGERLSASVFPNLVQILLGFAAIKPIWNGLTHLFGAG